MNRIEWARLDASRREAVLARPVAASAPDVPQAVAAMLADVRVRGDQALREYTARFDGVVLDAFRVDADELAQAVSGLPTALRDAIDEAATRIEAFHRVGMSTPYAIDTADGVRCERVLRAIGRVGLYVPAGSAPLPSTALMLGIPARLAGCRDVVLCTPPRADGSADPAVLYAAAACGIDQVYKLGGVQAIAAMAYGSATVPACDKLFGPGNGWVTEAKRQVAAAGTVGIDMPAGPSEVLVIADAGANPDFIAADLLSQAEHGPDSQVLLLSTDAGVLDRVERALAVQLQSLPRAAIARDAMAGSHLVQVESLEQAFGISNRYAPEHLILALREARTYLSRVSAAGSVFLGDWAPEALGDYCSGTNHVLPTAGAGRFCSGISVSSFQLAITVQEVLPRGLVTIGPCALELAAAEGLEAHRRAVALRLEALA